MPYKRIVLPLVPLLPLGILWLSFVHLFNPIPGSAIARHSDETSPFAPQIGGITPTVFIDICSQHANICPVDASSWQGEANAWQRTAKQWRRHSGTGPGIEVMWYGSEPYGGSNPSFAGQREVHYADYTNTPDLYPLVTGTAPNIIEWQRWQHTQNNYLLNQYGGQTENLSRFVGESGCDSGVYYPKVDHNVAYSYTPLSVMRNGTCIDGGYLAAYRAEMWGDPLSSTRIAKCDDPSTGAPSDLFPSSNLICKLSPYVGVVYQRYAWAAGPPPEESPVLGCEAVVYTWGWPEPAHVDSGQDYQIWFRNGELRFSKWVRLPNAANGELPAADDHGWWNVACAQSWEIRANWLYTGLYKIGSTIYSDTIAPPSTTAQVLPSGGTVWSAYDMISYSFPAGGFTDTVIITHAVRLASDVPPFGELLGVRRFFETSAVFGATGQPADLVPGQTYSVAIQYSDRDLGPVVENSLALYHWDGGKWSALGTISAMSPASNTITIARLDRFTLFALLGETNRLNLPFVSLE
jgi:hypothetical protein